MRRSVAIICGLALSSICLAQNQLNVDKLLLGLLKERLKIGEVRNLNLRYTNTSFELGNSEDFKSSVVPSITKYVAVNCGSNRRQLKMEMAVKTSQGVLIQYSDSVEYGANVGVALKAPVGYEASLGANLKRTLTGGESENYTKEIQKTQTIDETVQPRTILIIEVSNPTRQVEAPVTIGYTVDGSFDWIFPSIKVNVKRNVATILKASERTFKIKGVARYKLSTDDVNVMFSEVEVTGFDSSGCKLVAVAANGPGIYTLNPDPNWTPYESNTSFDNKFGVFEIR